MDYSRITRRGAVAGLAAGAACVGAGALFGPSFLHLDRYLERRAIPGSILGAKASSGHLLRQPNFPAPTLHKQVDCLIVGGGMAGLSAAWRLAKLGVRKVQLLELEDEVGGNSRSGANAVSAYPWGAHYIPLPSPEATLVHELFRDLGVTRGEDDRGRPVYEEFYLGADPLERLFVQGRWQEGLVPKRGVAAEAKAQMQSFFAHMRAIRETIGADGKPAFAVPAALSSTDERFTRLSRLTMAAYLEANGWTAPPLRWYVNYCMRDDFGCTSENTSAWAGVHYFASRRGVASNAAPGSVLTWPEGNGWLVHQLRAKLVKAAYQIHTNALAYQVRPKPDGGALVSYFDVAEQQSVLVDARTVVLATPRFVAKRLLPELEIKGLEQFTYAPWMVANITVKGLPAVGGAPVAWDNVSYHGNSLGYVVATHQSIRRYEPQATVLTFYLPLSGMEPAVERELAGGRTHADWVRIILAELTPMHPGIERLVDRIDVWLWGHGMIRPTPDFIASTARAAAARPIGTVFFAHSDLSGLSLFEEAQYWGVKAADDAARYLSSGKEA